MSTLGLAPAASADEAVFVIESANGSEDVWTQTFFDTNPVTAGEFRGLDRQRWIYDYDEDTFRNIGTGTCATAVDRDRIKGRDCDDDDPGQKWTRRGSGNSRLLVNKEFGTCAEYKGLDNPLRLENCDAENRKQRWYLNEQ
ncbi:ricin-type beta-trefoil lectin domain protein [Actinosynnema sp. NPDC047251]|uniref:ricin-type beta-trefoil lectin domain protein n=1 Tax=Saccharothrix espanaensis TaxID=103731 RepID=UPI00130DB64D|nr:ricin-type beta-trefoil lectin domain protein [Saccharothrix espanaensis]